MKVALRTASVLLAAAALTLTTARLGWWQLDRARAKLDAQALLELRRSLPPLPPAALARTAAEALGQHERRIELSGHWLPERTVYLENRQMDARVGFYACTPLRLDDGSVIVVQRGWLPRDLLDRTRIVVPPAPVGPVRVAGRLAPGPGRVYDLGGAGSGAIRQNLGLAAYAAETGLPLRPLTLVQEDAPNAASNATTSATTSAATSAAPGTAQPAAQDGLLRHWAAPAANVSKHHGYAFQWFALCALTIVLYVWFQVLRPRFIRRRAADAAPSRHG